MCKLCVSPRGGRRERGYITALLDIRVQSEAPVVGLQEEQKRSSRGAEEEQQPVRQHAD